MVAVAAFGALQYFVGYPSMPPKGDPPASTAFPEPRKEPESRLASHHHLNIEYVDGVVRALKQATPVSARTGLRGFHQRFPYFVTGTTGADVFRCLTGHGLRDFNVKSKIAGREECTLILVDDLESAMQLAASAPDVPVYSEEDWERIASCLAWATCEKGQEWDALPLPEVPEDDLTLDDFLTFNH
ncbi:hypothetical protein PG996_006049 [Apiospora saccharicola]|uniref:Uncharacterized protein n=1 Tax=Apiospora saccharicola TaxID=335842 RepID=A0ABR1VN72_9PEZI